MIVYTRYIMSNIEIDSLFPNNYIGYGHISQGIHTGKIFGCWWEGTPLDKSFSSLCKQTSWEF